MKLSHRTSLALLVVAGAAGALLFSSACSDDVVPGSDGGLDGSKAGGDAATAGDTSTPTDAAPGTDGATGDGATGDGGGDAAATGPYGLAYSGEFNNFDTRGFVMARLGSDGRILGYTALPSTSEAPQWLSGGIDGISSDTFHSLTRWTNGTINGLMYDDGGVKPIPANAGQHLALAKIPPTLPATGTANYTMLAATKPTLKGGGVAEGTITAGTLTAQFGGTNGTRVGYTITLTMPEGTFVLTGNGGPGAIGDAGISGPFQDAGYVAAFPTFTVQTDAGSCAPDAGTCGTTGSSSVMFAGPNVERIVIAFVFGRGSIDSNRYGAVAFQKQ